ncbi:male sterility protein [Hirsutella rhossiliensis]|uniref:Male sterility protein n=1 Tax=Hirsutella rhossiliensis TaxID=111463 RepID=A0A9P8SIE0_9HYPO|nr:male sterility protein [Hirsutella rhossiliensis]KAH0963079.1 male sterility protein [Hirsutella rhossiliensis]
MVPWVVCLQDVPVNRNGKVDKNQLLAMLLRRRLEQQRHVSSVTGTTRTEDRVKTIWQRALGAVDLGDIGPETNFFSLGAASLDVSAATMMMREAFQVPLLVQKLYKSPVLRDLARQIDQEAKGLGELRWDESKRQWLRDADMAEQLDIPKDTPIDWTAKNEGRVFVTGVTGFVGALFLRALVELPFVQTVRCLVRAKTATQGKQRILDNLSKYGLLHGLQEQLVSKVVPVMGDLSHPTLGLEDDAYSELAAWASVIFHLGA